MISFFFASLAFRRITCLTVLVILSAGIVGMPVRRPAPAKNGQFPCQDCPCGCSTAEYCWDKCCCHTDVEKLRWADEHGVSAPKFLVDRVAKSGSNASQSVSRCCSTTPAIQPSCCQSATVHSSAATCCKSKGETCNAESDQATAGFVRLVDVAKCQGKDLLWSVFNSIVIPDDQTMPAATEPPLLYRTCLHDERKCCVFARPDPPVPWPASLSGMA